MGELTLRKTFLFSVAVTWVGVLSSTSRSVLSLDGAVQVVVLPFGEPLAEPTDTLLFAIGVAGRDVGVAVLDGPGDPIN